MFSLPDGSRKTSPAGLCLLPLFAANWCAGPPAFALLRRGKTGLGEFKVSGEPTLLVRGLRGSRVRDGLSNHAGCINR
jgi:hypothetical protein